MKTAWRAIHKCTDPALKTACETLLRRQRDERWTTTQVDEAIADITAVFSTLYDQESVTATIESETGYVID